MFEWVADGVDISVLSYGGPECIAFLSPQMKLLDTLLAFGIACFLINNGYRNISLPDKSVYERNDRGGKRLLLIMVCLIWGIELGFKFATRTMIYLLNPCHVTTAAQIYLLSAPPSKAVTSVFRIHLNFLNGAVLAFMFPVTETRLLPFEASIYWIQHSMMLIVPYYLLRLGGVYNIEKLSDFNWCYLSYGLNLIYHFGVLQTCSFWSGININHIMCPIGVDPFYGQYYRIATIIHEGILCPLVSKTYCVLAAFFLTKFGPTKVKNTLEFDMSSWAQGDRGPGKQSSLKRSPQASPEKHLPEFHSTNNGCHHID
ncbi:transmembrane protein 164 [Schistocerca gregaria]|uniref:transmembrane protein 164 n=1 Tax=Schistocerca gregaria TaxID=7010 RepID=UPI00211E0F88|nr:transmembrane protein 164 [Schistocerca gregaria]